MTHTLPADEETSRIARRIAEERGVPVETVVRQAIQAQATPSGLEKRKPFSFTPEERLAYARAIVKEFAALPVFDPRPADEIIGYGDDGLPG